MTIPVATTPVTKLVPLPPCHVEGKYLFSIGKARIHAGGLHARTVLGKTWGLVINLTGHSHAGPEITQLNGAGSICPGFVNFIPVSTGYPELVIDWPDGQVPSLRRKNWCKLVADLEAFDGDVLIHCHGGHGRTGTLLAILGHLGGPLHGKDSVKWLRSAYCAKVVETQAQITYLAKNMNIPTKESPRFIPRPAWGVTQGQGGGLPMSEPWWTREEHDLTKPNHNAGTSQFVHDLPPAQFKCVLCCIHKGRIFMHSTFIDGTGYCILCNTEANVRMENY